MYPGGLQTLFRHISHFTIAMIKKKKKNFNHRETMKLLNIKIGSIHNDLKHVAEKSPKAYLINTAVSLRVTFCHTRAHRSSGIVPAITRGTLLSTIPVTFLVALNVALS